MSTRRSSARCAARAGRSGPGWPRFGRGGGTITISMSGFPARAAALNVVGKHRRRQATAAARSSIGGSPKRRVIRGRHHPENLYGLAICRRPVPRSSLRRPDRRCSFGAQRNEAVRHSGRPAHSVRWHPKRLSIYRDKSRSRNSMTSASRGRRRDFASSNTTSG